MMRRVFPGLAAPQGAVIIGIYLFGMTGIAAGAYAARDHIFSAPVASTDITDHMPLPNATEAVGLTATIGPGDRQGDETVQAPRLARLVPSGTDVSDGLLSPLSRIYFGAPSVTPPERPEIAGWADGKALSRLRPKLRPDGLTPDPERSDEDEAVLLASLNLTAGLAGQPESTENTAVVPETPRIVAPAAQCPKRLARSMPNRRSGAKSARAFLTSVKGIDGVKRDRQVTSEILKGNMPRFQRNLVPVNLAGKGSDGKAATITLCVTPDYLALGSDSDYVRVPLGLSAASQIAREFDMLLPTPRMVDAIYRQADLRLSPRPMTPGAQMTSTDYFIRHNSTVEAQRRSAGAPQGMLISGHKKDVVATSRLASNRGRVAIYGWHRRNGQPIQPLSTVHGAGYADYSHGIRLVSRTAYLNGREVDLQSLIGDPRYAGLVSHEGPLGRAALASN